MMTFRVERGQADSDELAVLASVLCRLLTGRRPAVSPPTLCARAPWWEAAHGYQPPGSWVAPPAGDRAWP
jgi:hypothetical protein